MKLYNYFRSSASYRVRIALKLKSIEYDYVPVHLNKNGGEQFGSAFEELNPASLVPVLEDGAIRISQSLAILVYLEECFPKPALLPANAQDRALVWQFALAIACDVHPLNNLRVLKYLKNNLGIDDQQKDEWIRQWIRLGFFALETELARSANTGKFCFGSTPTVADCCLIPQIYNAKRFGVDVAAYPRLAAIEEHCMQLEAFRLAHPSIQPDAE
jgi:maleylpyruvate isomerase